MVSDPALCLVQYALVSAWGVGTVAWARRRVADPRLAAALAAWGLVVLGLAVARALRILAFTPAHPDPMTLYADAAHMARSMAVNAVVMAVVAAVGLAMRPRFPAIGRAVCVQGLALASFDVGWAAIHAAVAAQNLDYLTRGSG